MSKPTVGQKIGPLVRSGGYILLGQVIDGAVHKCTLFNKAGEFKGEFAVKIMDQRWIQLNTNSPEEKAFKEQQIEREVTILQEVDSHYCAGLYDHYRDGSRIYLVMEFLQEGSLHEQIQKQGHFTEMEARHMIKNWIVPGVQDLHSKRIMYRDMKLANLLISNKTPTPDGILFDVKLADFGHSKIADEALTCCGSPGFFAPEVYRALTSQMPYDSRADWWTVGVVLYMILCGVFAFPGHGQELREKTLQGKFCRSKKFRALTGDAKDLIEGLLKVDPSERLTGDQILQHPWLSQVA